MDEPEKPLVAAYRVQRVLISALERLGFKPDGGLMTGRDTHGHYVIQMLPVVGERLAAWLDGQSGREQPGTDAQRVGQGEIASPGPVERPRPEATEEREL